jgi:hypothetical protein
MNLHPLFRRTASTVAVAFATLLVWLPATSAHAAAPVIEVIAFRHPPVETALKPLREMLARQGTKLRVTEIDMDTPEAERRLQAVGLKGHIPIVILIDGQYRHQRTDGSPLEFTSFPSGQGTPSGVKGIWSASDVEAVLKPRLLAP